MDTYSTPPGNNSRLLPLKATQTELRLCVGVGFSIHWLCFAALWPATKRDDYKEGVLLFSTYAAQHFATWTACWRYRVQGQEEQSYIFIRVHVLQSHISTRSVLANYHFAQTTTACEVFMLGLQYSVPSLYTHGYEKSVEWTTDQVQFWSSCGWWWRPVVHSTFHGLIRLPLVL